MAGVTRRFNGTQAVVGLDLDIPAGEVVGLIGPSGSGKTTLRPTFEEVFTTLVDRSRSGVAVPEAEPSPDGGDEGERRPGAAA